MKPLQIRDVKVIITAPDGINLVVVKIETNEPEVYGLGCATFTQRYVAVKTAIEEYLRPFLIGKDASCIEDIWQSTNVSGYWRNGPIMNNALSGVDEALWDIKGKVAGMPVYELLGGKCRDGIPVYRHADGRDEQEVEHNVRALMEEGYRYIRCQMGLYGGNGNSDSRLNNLLLQKAQMVTKPSPENARHGAYFDPDAYARSIPRLFEHLRSALGFNIELLHDIHERVAPSEALRMAKELEPYRLFFLEDAFAPEQIEWFQMMRNQTTTPIAMGELFGHPSEWTTLISRRLIDFIRCHVSNIGGITAAKKVAVLAEAFGVRTAWHGPGDVSPVGHAANLHLDMSVNNFGIQEWTPMSDRLQAVFPGCPQIKNGYACLSDKPGLGIDINEEKAKLYPGANTLPEWTLARLPDGTSARP